MSTADQFAAVVTRYQLDLYRWFVTRIGHDEDAEDLTARVFGDLWRKWVDYQAYSPWPVLVRFASHTLLDWHRRSGRANRRLDHYVRLLGEADANKLLEDLLATRQILAGPLEDCLEQIGERPRAILRLSFGEDWTDREIADQFSEDDKRPTSADAIKQLRLRTQLRLKRCLETKGVDFG